MATFAFYKDSGLTELFNPAADTVGPFGAGSSDDTIWLGSTDVTRQLQAKTNPGTDPLTITLADADPGNDLEVSMVKLATSEAGLDTAIAGDDLVLPATILGGVGNAQPIWVRVTWSGGVASDVDVSLQLLGDETAI